MKEDKPKMQRKSEGNLETCQLKIKNKEGMRNLLKDPFNKNSVLVEMDKEKVKTEVLVEYF